MKNRTTIKPTPKSLFNDFNARRGIATSSCNSMVNDGNYPVRVHKGEQRNRATFSRPTTPFFTAQCLILYQTYYSIIHEHLFVKHFCEEFFNHIQKSLTEIKLLLHALFCIMFHRQYITVNFDVAGYQLQRIFQTINNGVSHTAEAELLDEQTE